MIMPNYRFITSCVEARGSDINEMTEQAIDVSYRTMLRHCDGLLERRKDQGLTLAEDWHVSYCRSKYRGKRCYYVVHSSIEYIWIS